MPFCKNCKKKLSQDQFEKHFGLCSECFLTKSENYSKHNAHKTSNKSRRQRKKEILDQERAYTERLKQYRMKPLVERQTRKTTKSSHDNLPSRDWSDWKRIINIVGVTLIIVGGLLLFLSFLVLESFILLGLGITLIIIGIILSVIVDPLF